MLQATKAALALAATMTLAACGGGAADGSPQALADGEVKRARALAAQAISNDQLFQWAQITYPSLFGSAPPAVIPNYPFEGKLFDVRDFGNGNYLGVSNGRAYGYGVFTNNQLTDYGAVQDFASQVCSRVNCGGGSTGALNGCMMPASEALRVGNRYEAVYTNTVFSPSTSSGEYAISGLVEAAVAFEGQAALRVNSRVTGNQSGQAMDSTVLAYEQIADNELTRSLGSEAQISFSGANLTSRTVFSPPVLNNEFTLQIGQSLTKTLAATTTYINAPFPFPPSSGSSSTTYTYEARESITVHGRSFETCRYRQTTDASVAVEYVWYVVGRGIPAREESRNAAGTVLERSELKSATINGVAL